MEEEGNLCDDVENSKCLHIYVSAGSGCQATVTARTRCLFVKFRECVEL